MNKELLQLTPEKYKKIQRDYYEQLFANKMNNLDEMDIFLEINNFHKKRKYRPKSTDENRFKNSQQNIIKLNTH